MKLVKVEEENVDQNFARFRTLDLLPGHKDIASEKIRKSIFLEVIFGCP